MAIPVVESFVKLFVFDKDVSARFYEALGFTRVGTDGTHVHLRWGERGDVFLVGAPSGVNVEGRRAWGVLLGFAARDGGVDAVAAKAQALNAPAQGPEVQPWHTRDVVVTDPDGYRLCFTEPA
jgi:catechol 2,3-dioxygenase-like lactoylglutathione lyase family enzyme